MQGGAAEGTPQHQQILKIVAQSVRIWACQHVASASLLSLHPCMSGTCCKAQSHTALPRRAATDGGIRHSL